MLLLNVARLHRPTSSSCDVICTPDSVTLRMFPCSGDVSGSCWPPKSGFAVVINQLPPPIPYPTRPPTNNDLVSLEASANVMKILSDSIPNSHHQEILGSKQNTPLPVSVPTTSDTYATLTSVMPDSYDKQELNIIFDSLLQKWPEPGVFPDPSTEVSRVSLFKSWALFPIHLVHLWTSSSSSSLY